MFGFVTLPFGFVEIHSSSTLDLRSEAVSLAKGSERSLYWRHQLIQPYTNGHQLLAGAQTHMQYSCYKNVPFHCDMLILTRCFCEVV